MRDLGKVFTTEGLLSDRNGDGVADSLCVIFQIQANVAVAGLIDFCARLGLETSELDLPVMVLGEAATSQRNEHEWLCTVSIDPSAQAGYAHCLLEWQTKQISFVGNSEASLSGLLRWMAAHWPHGIKGELDSVDKISWLNEQIQLSSEGVVIPGGQIGLRLAEALPDSGQSPERPRPLDSLTELWTTAGFYQAGRVDTTSRTDVFFTGLSSAQTVAASARLAARIGLASTGLQFPVTGELQRVPELTFSLGDQAACSDENCVVGWSVSEQDASARIIHLTGGEQSVVSALDYLSQAIPHRLGGSFGEWQELASNQGEQQEFPLLLEKSWEHRGERAELEQLFQTEIDRASREVPETNLIGTTLAVTAFLSEPEEIRRELEQSWSRTVAELFPATECVVQIHSAFKPGFCWIKESILPAIKRVDKQVERVTIRFQREARKAGMELAHRWLQELYPVDQLLEKELGIALSQIELAMDEQLASTYQVQMWGTDGAIIGSWTLDVPVARVPYLDETRQAYPTTSGLFMQIADRRIEHAVATDREQFWQYYTQQFLPELSECLLSDQDVSRISNPLFHSIDVRVKMSEQEERLGIDEETISSLEALHEDIYFYTLDYFAHLGEKLTGTEWNAPGAVRPFVRVRPGTAPRATIRVKQYRVQPPQSVKTTQLSFSANDTSPIGARLLFADETGCRVGEWKRGRSQVKREALQAEWAALAEHPSVHIWEVEKSFEGRPIFAVEVTAPRVSTYVSPHMLTVKKATVMIETGHHPNEVSSMPAIRELVEEIITERADWLKHVNLVVIPFANPDGMALHQQLTTDNPHWKHHAARYNAVGLEFTAHRFQATIFGEAKVVPELFARWLPDVMIDDHGIPSHEWTQPFAGYNSPPRFPVSYWVPISLFYGIGRELDRTRYPEHAAALDAIQTETEKMMRLDVRLWEKNKRYVDRYIRYGHQWVAEVFPFPGDSELIFYRWPTEPDRTSTSLIARFPEWITLDLITEAADETVYDEALRDCQEAHKLFNRAVIARVASCVHSIRRTIDGQRIRIDRQRPLQIGREQS